MNGPIARCLAAAIPLALFLLPATALGIPIHVHHEKQIVKAGEIPVRTVRWTEVVNVAPLDADQDGVKDAADDCPQTAGSLANGCPPEPIVYTQAPADTGYGVTPPPASSGGMGCSGMEAESGSLGYANDTNPGYVGCYQISLEHYAPGGSCSGMGTDPAGQDACAAAICATEGAGAWTNSAGANPC